MPNVIDEYFPALPFEVKGGAAKDLQIFGAPTFIANRELFWGGDRLEQAIQCAKLGS